jgi:divalent metal cation (Fe/Co/Zn/Cd) transporter
MTAPPLDRAVLLRRGVALEVFTVAWNVVEAIIAITAGRLAGSIALVGFGVDSVIESVSGVVLYRRLRIEQRGADAHRAEDSERRALWLVGASFFLLAAYVGYEAVTALVRREAPEATTVGIVLAAVSLVVMPVLGWAKRRTGKRLNSAALVADSTETFVCAYLSLALLLGVGLNTWVGWWWADAVAALAMIPLMLHEGWEAVAEAQDDHDGHD